MTVPLRVLCLDIEGGYGGSSKSLFYSLAAVDRGTIDPTVWCKRQGPIQPSYAAIGISVEVEPSLPKASALPRLSRNIVQLGQLARDFWIARSHVLNRLTNAARTHDLVHFNHEGLAALALWVRHKTGMPATMHIRTNVVPSIFGRQQMVAISRAVDGVAFISQNEENTFRNLGGNAPGRVIFNPAVIPTSVTPHPEVPRDGRFNVASISNYALVRGTDRLLKIAQALRGSNKIRFVVAGDMTIRASRGVKGDADATFQDVVNEAGLSDDFIFLGHVERPETVLEACDCLIKPTREANPWGRDILEAMAQRRPVISIGQDRTFVETGKTGILMEHFDAGQIAQELLKLAGAPQYVATLGEQAQQRIRQLCDPATQAAQLADFWQAIYKTHSRS